MKKIRMTKSEKAFVERVTAIAMNPATVKNGKQYLNSDTLSAMPEATLERFFYLITNKTR